MSKIKFFFCCKFYFDFICRCLLLIIILYANELVEEFTLKFLLFLSILIKCNFEDKFLEWETSCEFIEPKSISLLWFIWTLNWIEHEHDHRTCYFGEHSFNAAVTLNPLVNVTIQRFVLVISQGSPRLQAVYSRFRCDGKFFKKKWLCNLNPQGSRFM